MRLRPELVPVSVSVLVSLLVSVPPVLSASLHSGRPCSDSDCLQLATGSEVGHQSATADQPR